MRFWLHGKKIVVDRLGVNVNVQAGHDPPVLVVRGVVRVRVRVQGRLVARTIATRPILVRLVRVASLPRTTRVLHLGLAVDPSVDHQRVPVPLPQYASKLGEHLLAQVFRVHAVHHVVPLAAHHLPGTAKKVRGNKWTGRGVMNVEAKVLYVDRHRPIAVPVRHHLRLNTGTPLRCHLFDFLPSPSEAQARLINIKTKMKIIMHQQFVQAYTREV